MKLRIATAVVASITLLAGIPALAQDGASLYKSKCAMCHGDQGQGKPQRRAEDRWVGQGRDVLTKGGEAKAPHIKPLSTVTADQVTSIAAYVKTLK